MHTEPKPPIKNQIDFDVGQWPFKKIHPQAR